jgi:hypothetical protein
MDKPGNTSHMNTRACAPIGVNEDGLAGLCDRAQRLCLALAFWNGRDPFLKERIFGLSGPEGNHGENAKEYWLNNGSMTPLSGYSGGCYCPGGDQSWLLAGWTI